MINQEQLSFNYKLTVRVRMNPTLLLMQLNSVLINPLSRKFTKTFRPPRIRPLRTLSSTPNTRLHKIVAYIACVFVELAAGAELWASGDDGSISIVGGIGKSRDLTKRFGCNYQVELHQNV